VSSRYVLEIESDEEEPWSIGFLGSVPDFTAVYRWNRALGLNLARTSKDREVVHENARTSHAEYTCWDADRGCRWTVLVNVPESGSWLTVPSTSANSLFANEVPSALRPLCSKPALDWLVLVHPGPQNPNDLLVGLSTAGKPVPLPQTLLRKLALELDSSPPHETH
jgi:hypothetical protein